MSIDGPASFVETNIVGTFTLLEVARCYWLGMSTIATLAAIPSILSGWWSVRILASETRGRKIGQEEIPAPMASALRILAVKPGQDGGASSYGALQVRAG